MINVNFKGNTMQKIEAQFEIVTPMFIGDAEQNATEISPSSVKGALRFWWRALNWGRFLEQAGNEAKALQLLHRQEVMLFGGLPEKIKDDETSKEKQIGQGEFLLRVNQSKSLNVKFLKAYR